MSHGCKIIGSVTCSDEPWLRGRATGVCCAVERHAGSDEPWRLLGCNYDDKINGNDKNSGYGYKYAHGYDNYNDSSYVYGYGFGSGYGNGSGNYYDI